MVGKRGLSTASRCTIVDCYLERRRRSRQDSEWVPPEHEKCGLHFGQHSQYTSCLLHATNDKYVGQSQSNWKDAFQFCYAGHVVHGPGRLRERKVWVIMREEFCYSTVLDNTTLFPNYTFQILSD